MCPGSLYAFGLPFKSTPAVHGRSARNGNSCNSAEPPRAPRLRLPAELQKIELFPARDAGGGQHKEGDDNLDELEYGDDWEALRKRGRAAEAANDLVTARSCYKRCTQEDPRLGKAWRDWAKVELRLGKSTGTVVSILRRGIAANRDNPYLLVTLGNTEYRRGNSVEARRCFRTSLGLDSSGSNIHAYLAMARFETLEGDLPAARSAFSRALAVTDDVPSTPEPTPRPAPPPPPAPAHAGQSATATRARIFHTWGIAEHRAQNEMRARALFRRGLAEQPGNPFIWVTMGQIAATARRPEEARVCFENAVAGVEAMERAEAAGEEVEEGERGAISFVLECWGRLETQEGELERASELLRRASREAPWDGAVLLGLSAVEMQRGNIAEARELAVVAIQKYPRSSMVWRHFARLEAQDGRKEEARGCFFRALKVDPGDWMTWEEWFDAEVHLGTGMEQARKFLDQSFAMRLHAKGEACALCCPLEDRHKVNAIETAHRRQLRGVKGKREKGEGGGMTVGVLLAVGRQGRGHDAAVRRQIA